MFLSSSSKAINSRLDLTNAINGSGALSGVPNAELLIEFTESANRQTSNLPFVRKRLIEEVGVEGMVDAAITVSIFRSLNIAADCSGIRVDDEWVTIAADLAKLTHADRFETAKNSIAVKDQLRET
ncbi:hypothetical protein CL649_02745 [bacterium]|nr:hypothetical protein [bacterium]|tara:strand:+ start:1217 stop:1594 length:378 start_codon:yes stop_codon:yes gene_type:complete